MLVNGTKEFFKFLNTTIGEVFGPSENELYKDPTIYLVPEIDDEKEKSEILVTLYAEIFENELEAWITDRSLWPRKMDFATFEKWFSVDFYCMVFDASAGDLEHYES